MQTTPSRVTTIDQVYATAAKMSAPVLIHANGRVEWNNRSFIERFHVNGEGLPQVKIRELLWCLGILEPIAGMISEGLVFHHCEVPGADPADGTLYLKQICLTTEPGGGKRMMLVLADEFDPQPVDITIDEH